VLPGMAAAKLLVIRQGSKLLQCLALAMIAYNEATVKPIGPNPTLNTT